MANWTILKEAIASVIKTNGNQEITGAALQSTLNSIVNSLGANATFAGIATPTTNPGTPDGPVFYFADTAGTYSNFNNIVVKENQIVVLYNIGVSWKSYDITNNIPNYIVRHKNAILEIIDTDPSSLSVIPYGVVEIGVRDSFS